MNFKFSKIPEEGSLILTDFNCSSFEKQFGTGDFYKIIWAKDRDIEIGIDGYSITLKKNHIMFCTPYNMLQFESFLNPDAAIQFLKTL